jgi:prepilin-type N-terminal cleavage/methylation domain-containing protein
MKNRLEHTGFTLIELMIVVAIIGVLASIAIPKFSYLIAKSQESSARGRLGALRSALSIYYGATEGWYPTDDLTSTLPPRFIPELPEAKLPRTLYSAGHEGTNVGILTGAVPSAANDMVGGNGWLYDNTPLNATWGRIIINCTHRDVKGNSWTSF